MRTGSPDPAMVSVCRPAFAPRRAAPVAAERSEVTDFRDPGTDDETRDGLNQNEESVRRGAEEVPVGRRQPEDMPVFDRGGAPPRR